MESVNAEPPRGFNPCSGLRHNDVGQKRLRQSTNRVETDSSV
jgi:hypothetical protein